MKKKKVLKVFGIVFILLIIALIVNSIFKSNSSKEIFVEDFESIVKWEIYDYEKDYLGNKGSSVTLVDNGYEGKAVLISGDTLNDTRIHRKIKVEPNSYYKLSVMANAKASNEGNGAAISAIQCVETFNIKNTFDEWQESVVYVKTSEKQDEIDFSLGLGGYSSISSGYVYYDNFKLEKIESLPIGANSITFKIYGEQEEIETDSKVYLISKLIFAIAILLLFIFSINVMKKKSKIVASERYKLDKIDYIIMAFLTLICGVISFYKLGDNFAPSSFWKAGESGEYIVLKFDEQTNISGMVYNGNIPEGGYYKISYSNDNENYIEKLTLGENINDETVNKKKKSAFFEWKYNYATIFSCKYIKIEAITPGYAINELAFLKFNENGEYEVVPFEIVDSYYTKNSVGTPEMLFDEQDLVPKQHSYMNSTYFDEVYFPRTAYEQLNGLNIYEITHPPFGKILISIGIIIFGMNPFGWRFMGTFFGVLLVPLMYLFAIKIFKKRKYAFIAAFLIMFDFMRFSHSRLATIDSFSTFFVMAMYYFMFDYFVNEKDSILWDRKNKEQKKKFMASIKPLFLCGIMFGIGASTKWSCVYAGAGLAFVFFLKKFFEYFEIRKIKRLAKEWFIKNFIPTCLWCIVFFVIIPLIIYILSYIPYMPSNPNKSLLEIVIDNQKYMYNYHSTLKETHPFQSMWYTWPFCIKPIWLFANYNLPNNACSTIVSLGNPAVWIPSFIAVFASIFFTIRDKDRRGLILLIAYAFQYLPWLLTTRCTFIYAYFIPLPFSILLLAYCMEKLNKGKVFGKVLLLIYLLIVLILFIMFFPVISGTIVSSEYVNSLKWLSSWYF